MIELERTFLAKKITQEIISCKKQEIIDVYIPKKAGHPVLRLRKKGNKFEMTKKYPIKETDSSRQIEQTIQLSESEFIALRKVQGKAVRKFRYFYPHRNFFAEFDVFQDKLLGLVLVDFEFKSTREKNSFEMPNFCLADITQQKFIAGGMLCGKTYSDIEDELGKFGYKKLKI